jgi:hypothetical protein
MLLTDLTHRVAARFMQGSYFSLGDLIYFGKYKNHVGKIVAFGKDHHGNPTIEVEPIPKGRKQNKVIGLFKVWRKDVKDKSVAEKALAEEAAEVAGKLASDEEWDDHDYDE